jgi:hypothetical protein
LLGLWLIIQAQTCAPAISPRRSGYNVVDIALHQPGKRGAFTLLLELNAGMLLLAAAAGTEMRAARRLALRAVIKTAFNLRPGVLFFVFNHDNFSLFLGQ